MTETMSKSEQVTDKEQLIAYCGLYCGACPSFTSGKCDGCRSNSAKSAVRYKQCQVKLCCAENGFFTCADCTIYASTKDCKKYNPLLLRIASRIEGSDRSKAIEMIKAKGRAEFLAFMEDKNWVIFKTKDTFLNKFFGKKVNE
jgi:hypothetical protein